MYKVKTLLSVYACKCKQMLHTYTHICIVCVPKYVSGYLCGWKSASVCYSLKPTFAFEGRWRVSSQSPYVSHFSIHIHEAFLHFRKKNQRERLKEDGKRRVKKKESIPCRDVRSESWLVSQPAGLLGLILKTSQLTSYCISFSCSHSLALSSSHRYG